MRKNELKYAAHSRREYERRHGLRERIIRMPKKPLELSNEERAYLAGFIDGEGCIRLFTGNKTPLPTVIVVNTNDRFREWISARIPFGTWKARPAAGRWKACHFVTWYSANAVAILEAVFPYLVLKKEQARWLLGLWRMEESFLKAHDMCRFSKNLPVPCDIQFQRSVAISEVAMLNKRGVA